MKTEFVLLAMSVAWTQQAAAAVKSIEGDWQGTLAAGGAELRLVLHIAKGNGGYQATLDSLDQGANGIPITSLSFKDPKLTFAAESISGAYEGTVSADGTEIQGSWSQGQALPLDFKRARPHKPAGPSDIDGTWKGTIDTGAATLRVVFHIANTAEGLTASLDSLDQGAKGIPANTVRREGTSLKMEWKQIGGVFEGKIAKDFSAIDGTWSQGGSSMPLALKR